MLPLESAQPCVARFLWKSLNLLITDVTDCNGAASSTPWKIGCTAPGVVHSSGMARGQQMKAWGCLQMTKQLFGTNPWKMTGHSGQRDVFN